jgi:hypothetical protein
VKGKLHLLCWVPYKEITSTFRKLDLLSSSGEGKITLALFGLLEGDNIDVSETAYFRLQVRGG